MLVRPAEISDIPAVARIHVDVWHSTYAGIVPQSYLDSLSYQLRERMWLQVIRPEHPTTLFVAEELGQIVGFVSAGPERGDTGKGELFTLYVTDGVQRSGVGASLFGAGALHLLGLNFSTMILWVLEDNMKGIAFYEKMGGKRTGSKMIDVHGIHLTEFRYEFVLTASLDQSVRSGK